MDTAKFQKEIKNWNYYLRLDNKDSVFLCLYFFVFFLFTQELKRIISFSDFQGIFFVFFYVLWVLLF